MTNDKEFMYVWPGANKEQNSCPHHISSCKIRIIHIAASYFRIQIVVLLYDMHVENFRSITSNDMMRYIALIEGQVVPKQALLA